MNAKESEVTKMMEERDRRLKEIEEEEMLIREGPAATIRRKEEAQRERELYGEEGESKEVEEESSESKVRGSLLWKHCAYIAVSICRVLSFLLLW